MTGRTKFLLALGAVGLAVGFTKKSKPTLQYRVLTGDDTGTVGEVEWKLQVDGKQFEGIRNAATMQEQKILVGDWEFTIKNSKPQGGYVVVFWLKNLKQPDYYMGTGTDTFTQLIPYGWITEKL